MEYTKIIISCNKRYSFVDKINRPAAICDRSGSQGASMMLVQFTTMSGYDNNRNQYPIRMSFGQCSSHSLLLVFVEPLYSGTK